MRDWSFDGGRVGLDLVNTLRDRLKGGRELLTDPAALAEWLSLSGLTPHRAGTVDRHVTEAKTLREAIDRTTRAVAEGKRPKASDIRVLNSTAAATPSPRPQLRIDAEGRPRLREERPADPVAAAFSAIAADTIELLTEEPVLRICAAHDCGIRFVDASPKHNRQWCSMSRCGNRAKARAHYAKRAGGGSGTRR